MPPLAGWSLTLVATRECKGKPEDATPLRGGVSRWLLQESAARTTEDAKPLVGWSLTLVATKKFRRELLKMPPPCGVESHAGCYHCHLKRPHARDKANH